MSELKALLFDVDGTMADTERDGHRVAFNRAFADADLDWDWTVDLYGKLLAVTGGKERIRYYLEEFNREFTKPADFDLFVAALHQSKTAHYTGMLGKGAIPLRPGVKRLLLEAKSGGIRLAIVTTTTPANVSALLDHTLGENGTDWFELIAAGDIVAAKKPAPDIFLWAMEQMGLTADQCLALEDSENGVKSVVSAGIKSLVVTTNGYTEHHDFTGAKLVVDQFGDPDNPSHQLSGKIEMNQMVDLELLRKVHEAAHVGNQN